MKDGEQCPTTSALDNILKSNSLFYRKTLFFSENNIFLAVSKVVALDFIPRSENGKILRDEIPYLMKTEKEESKKEEETESYV